MANLKKPGQGNVGYLVHHYIGLLNNINLLFLGTYGACCHFPFKYEGKKYDKCEKIDEPQPWCATLVDGDDNYIKGYYEFCADASCKKGKSV